MTALDDFHVGDTVDIDDGLAGVVVFNSFIGSWSDEFPEEKWSYMEEKGLMIRTEDAGLVFHDADYFISGAGRIVRIE
ncbi:MAG: hypothetical protein AB8B82_17835 [Roseovarius sp.]